MSTRNASWWLAACVVLSAPYAGAQETDPQLETLDGGGQDDDEVIEVTARPRPRNQTSEALTLLARQERASVSDAISSEEMSRTPDSSAADAVKRVVSATVVDGRYVFIRGLGDRYVSTLLNGVPLPSPEADRQAVPLDLFPTRLLSNLTVLKSYDASLPGRFGGGTLSIETRAYPEEFELKLSVSTSANSEVALSPGQTYRGGSLDFLGFDDGTRRLPDAVPDSGAVTVGPSMSSGEAERIGESFGNRWSSQDQTIQPDLSLSATVGDTVRIKGRPLGYLGSAGFQRSLTARRALVAKVRSVGSGLEYREEMDSVVGEQAARLGALANVGLEVAPGHELGLFGLYSHTGTDSATVVSGFNETDGQNIDSTRLRFVERSLGFVQLFSRHQLGPRTSLRWQGNLAHTTQVEPDTRDLIYNVVGDDLRFKSEPGSGERFFAELGETSLGTSGDLEFDTSLVNLSAGASIQRSDREFDARRFRFVYVGNDPSVLFLPPEEMLSATHIGPDFELSERTLPMDRYDARLLVAAGYGAAEMRMSERLRFVVGGRYEVTRQDLGSLSPFAQGDGMRVTTDFEDGAFLTSLSAIYAPSRAHNLRVAYGSTLARPQFRELAPFLFFDATRRRSVSGNPDLVNTHIHNLDLRWEWFPGATEVISAGVFGKYFVDPIEQVIVSASGGDVSFANAANATALGAEVEGRIDLVRFSPNLAGLRIGANAALVRSRVELTSAQVMSQTNASRPLQGQSPFAVNASATYERGAGQASVLYNVVGRRVLEVGFDTLPDVYEQPQHRLDLAYAHQLNPQLRLKASARNLLGQNVTLRQGELDVYRFQPGVSVGVGLEWTP